MITHNGKTMCAKDWDAELGFNLGTIAARRCLGWTNERALTQKVRFNPKQKNEQTNKITH